MTKFIMVRYNNKIYPQNIPCEINEVSGHFDKKAFTQKNRYSLHTEYSYSKRNFDSVFLNDLNEIKSANKRGIPQLWKNKLWAREYLIFIHNLLCTSIEPEIIEIHPPFIDYCNTFEDFLDIYESFEKLVLTKYNHVKIFLENRNGTQYGNKFLLASCNDIIKLCESLVKRKLELRIILDYPQLMSSEMIKFENKSIEKIINFNKNIIKYREYIGGIHLWGKKTINGRIISHNGDLNTLFNNNLSQKILFLESLYDTFHDNMERYMVLEVNSNVNDLHNIIKDLIENGFKFV